MNKQMRTASWIARGILLVGAATLAACSSNNGTTTGTGGKTGTGGTTPGTGGADAAVSTDGAGDGGDASCVGDPPVTEHNMCTTIASQKKGAAGFTISSPDFENCAAIPAAMTCDGKAFGTGSSPTLTWTGAPAGTMSYALVF